MIKEEFYANINGQEFHSREEFNEFLKNGGFANKNTDDAKPAVKVTPVDTNDNDEKLSAETKCVNELVDLFNETHDLTTCDFDKLNKMTKRLEELRPQLLAIDSNVRRKIIETCDAYVKDAQKVKNDFEYEISHLNSSLTATRNLLTDLETAQPSCQKDDEICEHIDAIINKLRIRIDDKTALYDKTMNKLRFVNAIINQVTSLNTWLKAYIRGSEILSPLLRDTIFFPYGI